MRNEFDYFVLAAPLQEWPSRTFAWSSGHRYRSPDRLNCMKSTLFIRCRTTWSIVGNQWPVLALLEQLVNYLVIDLTIGDLLGDQYACEGGQLAS